MHRILLAGDGGQGIQTIANIICQAAFDNKYYVTDIPNYGLEQRGGVSLAFLQINDQQIGYPKFNKPDILLIMSDQARERTQIYKQEGVNAIDVKDFQLNDVSPVSCNIFFLGILTKILEKENIFTNQEILKLLEDKLGKKPNWQENKKTFEIGITN